MNLNKKIFLLILLSTCFLSVFGQFKFPTFYNNGADIFIGDSSFFHINGNLTNNSDSSNNFGNILNNGKITTMNSPNFNNGDVILEGRSSLRGYGETHVENDWVNNASFVTNLTKDTSHVRMIGATGQRITGEVVTTFYDLSLDSVNTIKRQTLDARVRHHLHLNTNELAVDSFTMEVFNTDLEAITYDTSYTNEGFVSSLLDGGLIRHMNSGGRVYLFPVGSSLITKRFRPVGIVPGDTLGHVFKVNHKNYSPTIDGLYDFWADSTICKVNKDFYTRITKISGNDTAGVALYYDFLVDSTYRGVAQWNTPQDSLWNNIAATAKTQIPNYLGVVNYKHANFTQEPFALVIDKLNIAQVSGDTFVCYGNWKTPFYVANGVPAYNWVLPATAL
jgi:hypothetical protein